jgi:hypothetical protein
MRAALTIAIVAGALFGMSLMSVITAANARASAPRCGAEDSPGWVWSKCGNRKRGVVTMWGTPKTVTCGDLRWLVRHGDLDPHTPRLPGDRACGRR